MLLGWHNIAAAACPPGFDSYCSQLKRLRIGSRFRTKWAVLLLFAPLCNDSVQTRCKNHIKLPAALLGLDQHYNIILLLCDQSPSSNSLDQGRSASNYFQVPSGRIDFLDSPATNQTILIWMLILTSLSSSGKLRRSLFLFNLRSFLWMRHLARHIFSCDIY